MKFVPPLPAEKRQSIENLGFGILNKVALFYDKPFWDSNADYIGTPFHQTKCLLAGYASQNRGEYYLFVNMYKLIGVPALVAVITGQAAIDVESKPSKAVLASIHAVMKTVRLVLCFSNKSRSMVPKLPNRQGQVICFESVIYELVITRWRSDPFACGSYSYVATGSSGKDYDILGQPVSDYLFFAGEATTRFVRFSFLCLIEKNPPINCQRCLHFRNQGSLEHCESLPAP